MYLVGASHPHKTNAQCLLEKLIREHQRLVTNAEVLQKILDRSVATNRCDSIQPAFGAPTGVVDEMLAVDRAAVERAKRIVLEYQRLSARDAIHLAVMEQHGTDRILSFDAGSDGFPGNPRLR